MQGVAFNATLVPTATAFGPSGNPLSLNWNYLAQLGVPIVNNSLGLGVAVTAISRSEFERDATSYVEAFQALATAGTLMVVAHRK